MSVQKVFEYLSGYDLHRKIRVLNESSATVALAAQALGVEEARIAKTLSFEKPDGCILLVAAGDARIDNAKFRAAFGIKARMLNKDQVEALTGYAAGGVCPFDNPEGAQVYLDESLKRFQTVFPACGSDNSAIELDLPTLEKVSHAQGWVDVCKAYPAE